MPDPVTPFVAGQPGDEPNRTPQDEAALWADLTARIERAARRACPRLLAGEAQDIAQSALVRLLEQKQRGGIADWNASYLEKVAWSVAIDEVRRRLRRPEVQDETMDTRPAEVAWNDPHRVAGAQELAREMNGCLAALVPARRAAVALFLGGESVPAAARLLGHSTKKAEHLVYRGLEQLRACLQQKGLAP